MSVKALEMIFLEVDNLEESLDFYVTGLGFKVDQERGENETPMATLSAGRLRLSLCQKPAMGKRGRGVYFFITVEDVDEFYDFLRAGGFEVMQPPEDANWGGRFFTVVDPSGYRLFFVTWFEGDPYLEDPGPPSELGLSD